MLFFGSGDVALETVKLLDQRKDVTKQLCVVCPPQKSSRSRIPVRDYANQNNIEILTYDHHDVSEIVNASGSRFDMGVVVDFGYLIPKTILNQFNKPPILMHPSLLPKYRGAAPIEHALIEGEKETGITVLEVHPSEFDKGRILYQAKTPINDNDNIHHLRPYLAKKGAEAIIHCLSDYDALLSNGKPQDDNGVTKAPKIQKHDYVADFNSASDVLYNRWRGLGKLTTTLYGCTHIRSKQGFIHIILHEVVKGQPSNSVNRKVPGSLVYEKDEKTIWIRCGSNDWLGAKKVQIEGKNVITAEELNNAIKVNQNEDLIFKI